MVKTIAIIGVTGNQGSSTARAFLNEPGWTVRGITRYPSKVSAKKWAAEGVELIAADLDDLQSLKSAFHGANVIYGSTDFWQHMQDPATHERAKERNVTPNEIAYDREVEQGKAIVDAAAANIKSLDRFVISTLSEARKWSNGTITWNLHFDAKAEAVNYLKATYPDLWAKTSLLQLGYYANNWKSFSGTPKKQEDGTFKVSLPMSGDRKIPIVDPVADTGNFVKTLVDLPPGTNLSGAGSYMSFNEWCAVFSEVNNVTCSFEQIPRKALEDSMGSMYGLELGDMFEYFDKFGFNGEECHHNGVFPWELGVPIKYTTMEEYMKAEDWSSVL
ncbi:Nn.00g042080.m01.CDS01 [Neocucurbitaria sp. VM-36]